MQLTPKQLRKLKRMWVWNLFRTADMPSNTKYMGVYLCLLSDEGDSVSETLDAMAEQTGLSRQSVVTHTQSLECWGKITKTPGESREANTYHLHFPAEDRRRVQS